MRSLSAKIIFLVCAPLALIGAIAQASFPPDSQDAFNYWDARFAARPGPIEPHFLTRLLGRVPGCELPNKIEDDLLKYRKLIVTHAAASVVNAAGQALRSQARALLAQADDPCRNLSLAAYAAGSVALLTDIWAEKGNEADYAYYTENLSNEAVWSFVLVAAYRQGTLKFSALPPGGQEGDRILGYYDCTDTKVVVDPDQLPLNFAASLVHEFTHYYLDKNSAFNGDAKMPASFLRSFLLLDESLAALHAGHLQRRFAERYLRGSARFEDLTLYATDGPLARLSEELPGLEAFEIPKSEYRFGRLATMALFYYPRYSDYSVTDENGNVKYEVKQFRFNVEQFTSLRNSLYDRVSRAYFGRNLNAKERQALSPPSLAATFPSLWVNTGVPPEAPDVPRYFLPFKTLTGMFRIWVKGQELSEPLGFNLLRVKAANGKTINLMPAVKIPLLGFAKWSKEQSRLCQVFQASVKTGALKDYLGTKLKNRPKAPPRPGDNGVMPSDNGVMPGDNGVMPGDNGVMPSHPVRPCTQMGDRL